MRTLHEHERVGCVKRAIAILRDRDLCRPERLPDGQRDDRRVVSGYLSSIGLDLSIERLRSRERIGVVVQEGRDLPQNGSRQSGRFLL